MIFLLNMFVTKIEEVVLTLLEEGREVYFSDRLVLDAIFASIALPGLFSLFNYNGKWLIDIGVVNQVPISFYKKLGVEIVIAVNLNFDIVEKRSSRNKNVINNNDILKKISTTI